MIDKNEINQLEIENSEFIKKITDLEFEKSLLSQKNKLLEKKLESLTKKYNELQKELIDIETHIDFCKENQIQIVDLAQKDQSNQKEINQNNFYNFKNKIKILFEYDDDFLNNDSDSTVFNMIIDNIKNIQNDNLNLRRTLEDLKGLIEKNNNQNINNNYIINNRKEFNNNNNDVNNINLGNMENLNMDIHNPIIYEKHFNYDKNNIGFGQDSIITDEEKILRNNNYNNKYDINYNPNPIYNNNSKIDLNNLMNSIDNLQNVFTSEEDNMNYPSLHNKKYSSQLNRQHRLYHKYI